MRTNVYYVNIGMGEQLAAAEDPGAQLPDSYDETYMRHTFRTWRPPDAYSWDLASIRSVRDAHMSGDFTRAAALKQACKTDDAIFAALLNRVTVHRSLEREITADRARIQSEARETFATDGSWLHPGAIADGIEDMVMLGLGVDQIHWAPRPDGSRIDARLEPWPMHTVQWDETKRRLMAQTTDGLVEISHGDGKWVVWTQHLIEPWQWGAIKALSLIWADRAFGRRDRAQAAEAQGIAKIIGELPEGIALDSPEGLAFITALKSLRGPRSGGAFPNGSNVKMLESLGQSVWQIFKEILQGDTADIARVLLGQDGTMVQEGGDYIKSAQLQGIRLDIAEGDLRGAERAINTGFFRPWGAMNFDSVDRAPRVGWKLPDPDEDARRKSLAERTDSFNRAVKEYRDNNFQITQQLVNELAQQFGVMAPTLLREGGADAQGRTSG